MTASQLVIHRFALLRREAEITANSWFGDELFITFLCSITKRMQNVSQLVAGC